MKSLQRLCSTRLTVFALLSVLCAVTSRAANTGKAVVDGFQYFYTNLTATTCMIYNWEDNPTGPDDAVHSAAIRTAAGDSLAVGSLETNLTIRIPGTLDGRTVTDLGVASFSKIDGYPHACYIHWEIPNTVRRIHNLAFACNNWSSYSFASGSVVTNIGEQAFQSAATHSNPAFVIPASVQQIEYKGLAQSGFSAITFAEGSRLKSIGSSVFFGCTSLKALRVPDGLESLGMRAFYACWGLRELSLPGGIGYWGSDVFSECRALTTLVIRGDAPSSTCSNPMQMIVERGPTPPCTIYVPVAAKGFVAPGETAATYFPTCLVETVVLKYDSSQREDLRSMRVPVQQVSLSTVPSRHYDEETGLVWEFSSFGTPSRGRVENCYRVGAETDDDRRWIVPTNGARVVKAPAVLSGHLGNLPLASVSAYAFKNKLGSFETLDFSAAESMTSIGQEAFYGYEGLAGIFFPTNLQTIGNEAFRKSSVTNIVLPASLMTLNASAFRDCRSLAVVDIQGKTSVGNYSFYGCGALKQIRFRDTLAKLGDWSLGSCTGLVWIVFDKNAPGELGNYRSCFSGMCPNGKTNATILVSVDTDWKTWNDAKQSVNPRGTLWPQDPGGSGQWQPLPIDTYYDGADDIFVPASWCATYLPRWGAYKTVDEILAALQEPSVNYPEKTYAACFQEELVPRNLAGAILPFIATITVNADGTVTIDATPKTSGYIYTPQGRDSLNSTSSWGPVKSSSRFFRVLAQPL